MGHTAGGRLQRAPNSPSDATSDATAPELDKRNQLARAKTVLRPQRAPNSPSDATSDRRRHREHLCTATSCPTTLFADAHGPCVISHVVPSRTRQFTGRLERRGLGTL